MKHPEDVPVPERPAAPDELLPHAERTGSLALPSSVEVNLGGDGSESPVNQAAGTASGEWKPPSAAFQGTLRPQIEKGLSFREQEILALVAQGLTNGEIAVELGIGASMFKTHHASIASKLGVRERTEMVRDVYHLGGQIPLHVVTAYRLSERQEQIGRMIAEGRTNEQIGRTLYLTVDTVKTHIRGLLRKLGVGDRTHAAAILYECVDPMYKRPKPTTEKD